MSIMTKKLSFTTARAYKAPRIAIEARVPEEMLCDSNDGLTEDIGDVEDFTW